LVGEEQSDYKESCFLPYFFLSNTTFRHLQAAVSFQFAFSLPRAIPVSIRDFLERRMETVGVVRTGAGLAAEQRAGLLANSAVLHVRLLGLFLLRCRRTVLLAVRTEPFAFWGRLHVLVHTHLNTT